MTRELINILQLSIGFLFVFTAFQSCSNIQEYVIQNLSMQKNSTVYIDNHAGFYSLAIIYGVFTLFNFIAPFVVAVISSKWSMVIGAFSYALFLASFLYLRNFILYACSVLLGIGASLIWVGQGSYLSDLSGEETLNRNSGIFWALLQCSLPMGGIFVYSIMRNERDSANLSMGTVFIIYGAFTGLALLGCLAFLLLQKVQAKKVDAELGEVLKSLIASNQANREDSDELIISGDQTSSQIDSVARQSTEPRKDTGFSKLSSHFVQLFALAKTPPMLLLSLLFIYTGLELTFWSGLYGTAIAHTLKFTTPSKELLALNTIFIGVGEIVGGGLFGIFGSIAKKLGHNFVIYMAFVVHIISFFLIFLNIPAESPYVSTNAESYIEPNEHLALFCSILLGFGDACWNTQIYSYIGSYYANNSASAFGLFKFFQSAAACVAFFYSIQMFLHWQLVILVAFATLSVLAFFIVERKAQQALLDLHEKHG